MNFFKRAALVAAAILCATTAQAVTFKQQDVGVAGQFIGIDVDLSGFSGVLGGFALAVDPDDRFAFGGVQDDRSDGGVAPLYQVRFANNGVTSPMLNATTGSSQAQGVFVPSTYDAATNSYQRAYNNGQSLIFGTSVNVPVDNLSKFTLFFASLPGTAEGVYKVSYSSSLTVAIGGVVEQGANASNGTFDITIGNPEVIPLPAGGVLLVTGLGALAMMRRRTLGNSSA